ncbi:MULTISPECIES: ParB/RepB/Spo0J family partition protein [unclassified Delftia]|uniref:ParB/RepB/Spo0J family partition protein n=1 Tax=unclassified Delftia TaxID=2613839 RepID=UPI001900AFD3|nr:MULTISPECIES: ParB/RepB/Spo0J family partition protein [unclassified Delftia]MBK0112790.1 ParB/RepB/Spo0J family partition protein [Delftia sp. S65]MBK0119892.1 ParB/RepB/Spo0J family partition protein [Delftia sp. S67]MBK0131197.1 ParB/RepB/Spo0J family partition protein [Delftia sp. S66]
MTSTHDAQTAAMPTPGAGALMLHVPVMSIARSLRNPRKHFDQAKLQELADSIKATGGALQPILLRPLPESRIGDEQQIAKAEKRERAQYELVAGERRWRASQLAGVAEIPAMIRPMSDADALRAAVIENLQRTDITKLEEAEGYRELLDLGETTAEKIAEDVGKSRTYVFNVMKILDLCEEVREVLRKGDIDFSRAQLLARIPSAQLQIKALKDITRTDWQGEKPSYRACEDLVQNEYMVRLDRAKFTITDATLVPSAGSCADCSKRTGANAELKKEMGRADICTDKSCYEAKAEAHTARIVQEAKDKGHTVIVGKEAEELQAQGYNEKLLGYRRLDAIEDSPGDHPLRKIIGDQMKAEGIQPVKIESPRRKGELVDALPNETVLRLLKIVDGQAKASEKVAKEARQFSEAKKAQAEAKAKAKFEQAWRDALLDRAWNNLNAEQPPAFNLDVHRYLALRSVKSLGTDDAQAIADVLGFDRVGAHAALIEYAKETVNPDFLQLLCIMQGDSRATHNPYNGTPNEGLMLVAGAVLQERLQAVIKEVKIAAADKHLPKIAPVKPAAPKADLPLDPAARAGESRAKGKAKKSPAARASAEPKTTAAEASAAIAAALQDQESGAAAAAQGDDTGPVAADAAQGLPPSSEAADIDHTLTPDAQQSAPAQTATANDGQDSADAGIGAADQSATSQAPELHSGDLVRVKAGLKGPTGRPRKECGRVGVVRPGHLSLIVEFGAGVGQRAGFEAEELEPYTADPLVGKRVRVLNPDSAHRWQEGAVAALTAEGWKVEFAGKPGSVSKAAIFETKELESLA